MQAQNNNKKISLEPFIRWAGGKRKLIHHLVSFLPEDIYARDYKEPFMGAASLFFAIRPEKAFLSDANEHLISCFLYVKKDHKLVCRYLAEHMSRSNEKYYYLIRNIYNESIPSAAQSARFIYLNKTCFNGIFRVNRDNKFNVPYGRKEPPNLPSMSLLKEASDALRKAIILSITFEDTLKYITDKDFVYVDPPYPPLNGTSYFTHYTKEKFGKKDQVTLANYINKLDDLGAKFMMSNADIPLVREMYSRYNIYDISVTRWITCKSKKHKVSELIITNYDNFLQ